jgi:hypothetical protein
MHWLFPQKYCNCGRETWGGEVDDIMAPGSNGGTRASVGAIRRCMMVGWRFMKEISESVRLR